MTICAVAVVGCGGQPDTRGTDQSAVLIRNVSVVDVEAGRSSPPTDVFVIGDRITKVGAAIRPPESTALRELDGTGLFVLAGLWDMHSHSLWDTAAMRSFLPQYTVAGVTGIRDMGGKLAVLAQYRREMREVTPPWPRVVASGEVLDGPEPVQADIAIPVADSAAAARTVDSLARAGADFIKVYTLLPSEAYAGAGVAARRHGLPLTGHLPAAVPVRGAIAAGQRSIEHLREEIEPFCLPRDDAACAELARDLGTAGVWQVPTLVALRPKAYYDDPADTLDPRLALIPEDLRREWISARRARARRQVDPADRRARYAHLEWLTAFFVREGVPVMLGSDAGNPFAYPGSGVHDELELLVRAGLTPAEALHAATVGPARYLAAEDSMGRVAAGQVADLVLLRRDPLEDIRAVREVEAVILRGRVLDRAALDRLLEPVRGTARP